MPRKIIIFLVLHTRKYLLSIRCLWLRHERCYLSRFFCLIVLLIKCLLYLKFYVSYQNIYCYPFTRSIVFPSQSFFIHTPNIKIRKYFCDLLGVIVVLCNLFSFEINIYQTINTRSCFH